MYVCTLAGNTAHFAPDGRHTAPTPPFTAHTCISQHESKGVGLAGQQEPSTRIQEAVLQQHHGPHLPACYLLAAFAGVVRVVAAQGLPAGACRGAIGLSVAAFVFLLNSMWQSDQTKDVAILWGACKCQELTVPCLYTCSSLVTNRGFVGLQHWLV